jgi:IS5 family transposase
MIAVAGIAVCTCIDAGQWDARTRGKSRENGLGSSVSGYALPQVHVYRRFTHYDAEVTPDYSTFSRLFALLSTSVTEKIHQRVVQVACELGVAQGRKVRTDTTVVETNIHHPTDSSLLGDGIRVLSRGLARIAAL